MARLGTMLNSALIETVASGKTETEGSPLKRSKLVNYCHSESMSSWMTSATDDEAAFFESEDSEATMWEEPGATSFSDGQPLCQQDLYNMVTEKFPAVLTRSFYAQPTLEKPLFRMSLDEKRDLFLGAFRGMQLEVAAGASIDVVAYDHTQERLWSLALQGMWQVSRDRQQSQLGGLESLLSVHAGSWGVGLLLDVIGDLLDNQVEVYLEWKQFEIKAAVATLQRHEHLPPISINLRPSEWMMERVQDMVLDATQKVGHRIMFELTEYTGDTHFARFFGTAGSLSERLTMHLLPVLRRLKAEGVRVLADDLLPASLYRFGDDAARKRGTPLVEEHATLCELMLSEEWSDVLHSVKFGIEWAIHALALNKETGPEYAEIPIYKRNVKDNAAYVAAVTDGPLPTSRDEEVAALSTLQAEARSLLAKAVSTLPASFSSAWIVLEGTVPVHGLAESEWDMLPPSMLEQGGMFFEARFPPAWFLGLLTSTQ